MKQGQRLNRKFSVKDTDLIVALAIRQRTAEEICTRLAYDLGTVSVHEIQSICWQSGVKVRAAEQA